MQQQQPSRNTYDEHPAHARHLARVPLTDVLVEGKGLLQYIQGRMAVSSEHRDIQDAYKTVRRQRSSNKCTGSRTANVCSMFVTLLVSHLLMSWLKAWAYYSSARDEWPSPVSVETSRTYTKR